MSWSWLPVWLQPPAVTLVVVLAAATHERYPTGHRETVLIVALTLLTLPGLVAAVADGVRRSAGLRPGEQPYYQRVLEGSSMHGYVAALPRSTVADVAVRVLMWGVAQSAVGLLTAVALTLTPLEERWSMLVFAPALLSMLLAVVVLLGVIAWLGILVVRVAARKVTSQFEVVMSAGRGALPPVFRALLVAVGTMLLGLATRTVLEIAALDVLPWNRTATAWTGVRVYAAEVAWWCTLTSLAAIAVLSPLAFRRMRRRAPGPGGPDVR